MTTEPQHGPAPAAAAFPRPAPGAEAPRPTPDLAPDGQPLPPAAPEQAAPPAAPALPQHMIKRTRTSGVWVAVGFFAVVLLLLLIFILQNGTQVSVSYLGLHGRLPLGVALLLSAVCGVLLVVLAGAARISQLRTVARRHRRADTKRAAAQASGEPAGPAR
jgi:lipopolysaccharide assembly protein A